MKTNIHLYRAENASFHCCNEVYRHDSYTVSGEEYYEMYSSEAVEAWKSFNDDFWLRVALNDVPWKSDWEIEFLGSQYSILELLIISENIRRVKSYKRDKLDSLILIAAMSTATSRLSALDNHIAANECFSFLRENGMMEAMTDMAKS